MTSGIGKSIKISLGDKMLAQFPEELADIAVAIEKSRYVLGLEKDFDGMDSEPTSPETWQKAVRFVADYANWLFDLFGKKWPSRKSTMLQPEVWMFIGKTNDSI